MPPGLMANQWEHSDRAADALMHAQQQGQAQHQFFPQVHVGSPLREMQVGDGGRRRFDADGGRCRCVTGGDAGVTQTVGDAGV